jgi:hypothetical protein
LLETRQPLDEPQYTLAKRAWQAFREPTPEPLQMHDGETAYYITDTSLAGLAEELSRGSHPLLTLAFGNADTDEGLRGTVMLTGTGRAVLARQLDRVATCGIDRWLGGVHLHGGGTLWRWDDARQRVTRASTSPH